MDLLTYVLAKKSSGGSYDPEAVKATVEEALSEAYNSGRFNGSNGADGVSPTVEVQQLDDGVSVSITDKNGTTIFTISNGKDGATGKNGSDGKDGTSPTIAVTDIIGGHRIIITDVNGVKNVDVMDGNDGASGSAGKNGSDGYSPSASVTKTDGVSTITITDKNGTTTAECKDGVDGKDGVTPVKGADYFTETEIKEVANQAADIVAEKGLIVNSSTPDSTKKFQITVDDEGTITATPVE